MKISSFSMGQELVVGDRLKETVPLDLQQFGNRVEVIAADKLQIGGFNDVAHTWDTDYTRNYNVLDDSGAVAGGQRTVIDGSYWGYDDYGLTAMTRVETGAGVRIVETMEYVQ